MYIEIKEMKNMVDNGKEVRKQILSCIGCVAAAVTIIAYLVLCIHSAWNFIDETSFIYNVLVIVRTWAPLVVVGITGLEFIADKNIIIKVVFYVAIALVVVFMFFPSTWTQFVGVVDNVKK